MELELPVDRPDGDQFQVVNTAGVVQDNSGQLYKLYLLKSNKLATNIKISMLQIPNSGARTHHIVQHHGRRRLHIHAAGPALLLLLGTEKYGIPAELLGELDWCVEIPQQGRTRSMNVQTAAAVVLYDVVRARA